MVEKVTEDRKPTMCGCGRSPLGFCIGWHALGEDEFRQKLAEYEASIIPKNRLVE
jgi:hypothetical protein